MITLVILLLNMQPKDPVNTFYVKAKLKVGIVDL